jgi:hypothetical protein
MMKSFRNEAWATHEEATPVFGVGNLVRIKESKLNDKHLLVSTYKKCYTDGRFVLN